MNRLAFDRSVSVLFRNKKVLYTPFYHAIRLHQLDMVKQFCVYGYDISKKIGGAIFTYPLLASIEYNDTSIFNFLVKKGADVSVKDYQGKNALMFCVTSNNLELTKLILQKSYPINDKSNNGFTALMYAIEVPGINSEIINLLINSGIDGNYVNSRNQSAFSLSCFHNNRNLALYLLDHGAKYTDNDFESNARMDHFSGDYYLSKGDLTVAREYYLEAKQYYNILISEEKEKIANINATKLLTSVLEGGVAVAGNMVANAQANQYTHNVAQYGMVLNNSQKRTLAFQYSEEFNAVLYDDVPVITSLDEQKAFYKRKKKQFELSICLIDGILACCDKGLTGEELNSCIKNIKP